MIIHGGDQNIKETQNKAWVLINKYLQISFGDVPSFFSFLLVTKSWNDEARAGADCPKLSYPQFAP